MRATISRKELLDIVTRVERATERKATMPILACVRLRVEVATLTVEATNLQLSAHASLRCWGGEAGEVALNGKLLLDTLKGLRGESVIIASVPNGMVDLSAEGSNRRLVGADTKNVPKMPAWPADMAAIDGKALHGLLDGALPTISTDDNRLNLNYAMLESAGEVIIASSTDGNRATRIQADVPGLRLETPMYLHRRSIKEAVRLLATGEVASMARVGHQLYVAVDGVTYALSVEYTPDFPPVAEIAGKFSGVRTARVDRDELREGFKRVALVADKLTLAWIGLDHGQLRVSGCSEVAAAKSDMDAPYDGAAIAVALARPALVASALGELTEGEIGVAVMRDAIRLSDATREILISTSRRDEDVVPDGLATVDGNITVPAYAALPPEVEVQPIIETVDPGAPAPVLALVRSTPAPVVVTPQPRKRRAVATVATPTPAREYVTLAVECTAPDLARLTPDGEARDRRGWTVQRYRTRRGKLYERRKRGREVKWIEHVRSDARLYGSGGS